MNDTQCSMGLLSTEDVPTKKGSHRLSGEPRGAQARLVGVGICLETALEPNLHANHLNSEHFPKANSLITTKRDIVLQFETSSQLPLK